MPSQFFGLNIAYKGLLASNAALNTTANNISNVQTEGYSRQEVPLQASTPIRVFQTYGCAGAGVETLTVERIRDEYYDTKYWRSNTVTGQYDMKNYYMEQVETYFDDDGTNAGFKTIFDQFNINGLEELLKNPGSDKAKAQYVGTAGNLTEYFNGLAGNLENLQRDINLEIKSKVDEISALAGEIATLNTQINIVEIGKDQIANELRDRRTLLVDQLSAIVDVSVTETPVIDTNYPDRDTGSHRFIVRIAGEQLLVDGSDFRSLECVARNDNQKVNQTDIDGLYEVYWGDGQEFNLYNASMGGQLRGLVDMRDGNNGEEFYGKITATSAGEVGQKDTVTVQVSEHYLQDLNKCNLSDQGGRMILGNQEFYYDSWACTISYDDNGEAVYSYTFELSESPLNERHVTNDRVGMTATVGHNLDYQGIPYYMNQMNEWVRTYSEKYNAILNSGYDAYGQPGCNLFTSDNRATGEQFDFPGETRFDTFTYEEFQEKGAITVKSTDDSYYRMTAKNYNIVKAVLSDANLLANKKQEGDGVEQNNLLKDLQELGTDRSKMSFRGATASEFLQCMLSDVALNASGAKRFYESNAEIRDTIDTQRMAISGVDEDEEAMNLVKYQNAYNLSAKMIQVFKEIYDRLIRETGV